MREERKTGDTSFVLLGKVDLVSFPLHNSPISSSFLVLSRFTRLLGYSLPLTYLTVSFFPLFAVSHLNPLEPFNLPLQLQQHLPSTSPPHSISLGYSCNFPNQRAINLRRNERVATDPNYFPQQSLIFTPQLYHYLANRLDNHGRSTRITARVEHLVCSRVFNHFNDFVQPT